MGWREGAWVREASSEQPPVVGEMLEQRGAVDGQQIEG